MKALAFGDIHGNSTYTHLIKKKAEKCDFILCSGDISNFGVNLKKTLYELNKLKKPIFLVHGNHEDLESIKKLRLDNIKIVHKTIVKYKDYNITGYGNLGFSERSIDVENFIDRIKSKLKNKKVIFISHAPPKNTKLDLLPWSGHVGCISFRKAINILNPEIYICGHLHENFGMIQRINNTKTLNPGPKGIIIDL